MAGFVGYAATLALSLAVTVVPATAAHAWDATPSVACDAIVIDPPTWIKVTFAGTVDGKPFSRTTFYGGDGSHNARIDIADLTAGKRTAHIVVTATSPFFGTSHSADVDVDCGVVGQEGGSERAAPAAEEQHLSSAETGLLPFTGADLLTLTLIGLAMVVAGLSVSRVRARRTRIRYDTRGFSVIMPPPGSMLPHRKDDGQRST